MTDNEIIQALECCAYHDMTCQDCPYAGCFTRKFCERELHIDALNFIKRQQEEIDNLLHELSGVMHFVDKWLDGAELEQDETNRAITMREKTLRIVEEQQAEIEQLKGDLARDNDVPTKWISVKDRLPDFGRRVLILGNRKDGQFIYIDQICADGDWLLVNWEVTHWMPLPEPPKGD